MSDNIQKKHRLSHIPALRIDPDMVAARFPHACAMVRCSGVCCRDGVWLDPVEHNRILQHANVIQQAMDSSQEKEPSRWFDGELASDADFPSGRAIGTAVANGGCIFLNSEKRCVLQIASTNETGDLKPFFCFAFPITIDHGLLCIDDARDAACCTPDANGSRTIVDICPEELTYVLGPDGFSEFRKRFT